MPLNPYAPLYQPRQNYYYYTYNPVWLVPVVHSEPVPLLVSSLVPCCEPVLPVSSWVPCEPQPAGPSSSSNLHFPRSSGPFRGKRLRHNKYNGKTGKRAMAPMRVCGPRKELDLDGGRGKWVPKNKQKLQAEEKNMEASSSEHKNGGPVIPFPPTFDPSTTTVMVKNIPNQFRRHTLLEILRRHCFEVNRGIHSDPNKSKFDFVYLPIDFGKIWKKKTISNLGYAFVNFTTPAAAHRFCGHFQDREWRYNNTKKTCDVKSAKFQGKAALLKHFKNKKFWCESAECLPGAVEPACDGSIWYQIFPVGKLTGVPPYKS
ncbi:PREDICTED: protein terminal ear1-like [Prunus mume]|uniref:Protein terminal ear1-like n=1 Tax=Prunus mume TaxID=102107 RepID=A0ABM1LQW5_PRUMU|nr:PREDICTED: protein terminal ear1-like [Prunus mume]